LSGFVEGGVMIGLWHSVPSGVFLTLAARQGDSRVWVRWVAGVFLLTAVWFWMAQIAIIIQPQPEALGPYIGGPFLQLPAAAVLAVVGMIVMLIRRNRNLEVE
jgi:hypothetical protein